MSGSRDGDLPASEDLLTSPELASLEKLRQMYIYRKIEQEEAEINFHDINCRIRPLERSIMKKKQERKEWQQLANSRENDNNSTEQSNKILEMELTGIERRERQLKKRTEQLKKKLNEDKKGARDAEEKLKKINDAIVATEAETVVVNTNTRIFDQRNNHAASSVKKIDKKENEQERSRKDFHDKIARTKQGLKDKLSKIEKLKSDLEQISEKSSATKDLYNAEDVDWQQIRATIKKKIEEEHSSMDKNWHSIHQIIDGKKVVDGFSVMDKVVAKYDHPDSHLYAQIIGENDIQRIVNPIIADELSLYKFKRHSEFPSDASEVAKKPKQSIEPTNEASAVPAPNAAAGFNINAVVTGPLIVPQNSVSPSQQHRTQNGIVVPPTSISNQSQVEAVAARIQNIKIHQQKSNAAPSSINQTKQ